MLFLDLLFVPASNQRKQLINQEVKFLDVYGAQSLRRDTNRANKKIARKKGIGFFPFLFEDGQRGIKKHELSEIFQLPYKSLTCVFLVFCPMRNCESKAMTTSGK